MKILLAGNGERGVQCLKALSEKYPLVCVIAMPKSKDVDQGGYFLKFAKNLGLKVLQPTDINDPSFIALVNDLKPELGVLAGYGQIVNKKFINLFNYGCLNLHAGKLPEFRGSSPMNWTLIKGESSFSISIIKINEGVDTGDIAIQKTFPIDINDNIKDLHGKANKNFPVLLMKTIKKIAENKIQYIKQVEIDSAYYPLRFPEDGLIIWDSLTALEIHNKIRALTKPYPGAFTYYKKNKLFLVESALTKRPYYGEPGRIYKIKNDKILVCAKDKCLWINNIQVFDNNENALPMLKLYEKFITINDLVVQLATY